MFWTYMLGPATLPRTHEGRGAVASGGGSAGPGTPGPARAHPGATCARSEPSSVFVSRVERGATGVTVNTVAALCGVLGVTLAEFFEPFTQVPKLRGPGRRRRS